MNLRDSAGGFCCLAEQAQLTEHPSAASMQRCCPGQSWAGGSAPPSLHCSRCRALTASLPLAPTLRWDNAATPQPHSAVNSWSKSTGLNSFSCSGLLVVDWMLKDFLKYALSMDTSRFWKSTLCMDQFCSLWSGKHGTPPTWAQAHEDEWVSSSTAFLKRYWEPCSAACSGPGLASRGSKRLHNLRQQQKCVLVTAGIGHCVQPRKMCYFSASAFVLRELEVTRSQIPKVRMQMQAVDNKPIFGVKVQKRHGRRPNYMSIHVKYWFPWVSVFVYHSLSGTDLFFSIVCIAT